MNETTWRVDVVIAKPGVTMAELYRVEWFKPNPAYEQWLDNGEPGGPGPDEFLDAKPGEPDAEVVRLDASRLTLDITEGPELRPNDDVMVTVKRIEDGDQ